MLGAARWPTSDRVQVPSGKRTDSSILEENRSSAAWSVVISTPQNRSLKRRRITLALLICAALLLVYGASPYFSFWRFTVALRSGDSAAVTARVDFPAIRASEEAACRAFRSCNVESQTMEQARPDADRRRC